MSEPHRSGQGIGRFAASALTLLVGTLIFAAGPATAAGPPRSRQPSALALSRDGGRLFVANRRSGSLSVIDTRAGKLVSEHDLGQGLSDVAALPDGRHLLAVDQAGGALLLVQWGDGAARVVARLDVGPDPSCVAVQPDGSTCFVSVTGARRLVAVALAGLDAADPPRPALKPGWGCDVPFAPRNLALVRGVDRLVAADAYGGRLAVVDPTGGTLEAVRQIPAHNIRGLCVSPDGKTLVVAHQVLRRLARTSFEDVHWGALLSNHLRILQADSLSSGDVLRGARLVDLGGTGNAAADPAGVAFDRAAGLAVTLAGVNELALGAVPDSSLRRVAVGRHPTAVTVGPGAESWYVADSFDDTVTVVDRPSGVYRATIPLGTRPEPGAVARGERLFFDATLSHDGWMSCHSCHTDGRSNNLLSDTLGDGSYGAPKRVPSLLGVGATGPWGWTGAFARLEDQVRSSIETTMQGARPTDRQVADLTAYLRSLPAPRAVPSVGPGDAARGRDLFRARRCHECHEPPEYTSPGRYDVGLADEVGNRKFNPPSLRGVGTREPLLHDGRAATLADVFRHVRHPRDATFTDEEIADLVAFLKSL